MMIRSCTKYLALSAMILLSVQSLPIYAKDLGVMGETYPIAEVNFMTFIQSRISDTQKNGQWQLLQHQMQQQAVRYRDRPKAVSGVTRARETKSFMFDPSIVLDRNVIAPDGRLIARAGASVNPLDHIKLSKALVFFDGDDAHQVKWVAAQEKVLQGHTKLILINGSLLNNEKYFSKPVYFDQSGQLTHRFGIHHVPAVVAQQGNRVRITEVKV